MQDIATLDPCYVMVSVQMHSIYGALGQHDVKTCLDPTLVSVLAAEVIFQDLRL